MAKPFSWRLSEINAYHLNCSGSWTLQWVFADPLCSLLNKHTEAVLLSKNPEAQSSRQSRKGKGGRERWSDSPQITPQDRSEPAGGLAFPDSQSRDCMTVMSRKEWITDNVFLRQSPCLLTSGGSTCSLREVQSSPPCSYVSFGQVQMVCTPTKRDSISISPFTLLLLSPSTQNH